MKTILILLAMMLSFTANAQSYTRQGNTFVSAKSTTKAEPVKTKYNWQDSKGNSYPIYISQSGSCFVFRVSAKTGKEYKQYLGKEISAQISKEMGIEYKPRGRQ